jgi:class 3 adenylate cyclase
MHSPSCGFDNPAGMNFCGRCGTKLSPRCPHCAFENPPGFAFCGKCGASLVEPTPAAQSPPRTGTTTTLQTPIPAYLAEKILTSKAALEGERKQVTVLFADLKGSMELLADRDPEEARQLLDPVLTLMMAAVHRYEGIVNQVMGDGVMALFSAPIAHEDHAVRACYAALAMQTSVQQYAAEMQRTKGVPIHIRVGLNSGEVVVRSIGSDLRMDYTAVGQTTHLGARMEQLAMPGSIVITADVLRLAEGYIQVTSLGPVPIKGLPDPVEVYQVTAAYLLVHATSRDQLAAMCQAVVRQLKPGGRFVALTINPQLVPAQLPRVEHYGSGVTVQGPLHDGSPVDVMMLTASGPLRLRDYHWSQNTYKSVLHQAGFDRIVWHAMQVSAEGFETYGNAYWQAYLTHPHIVVLEAQL